MRETIGIVVLGVIVTSTIALVATKRRDWRYRRLLPAVVVSSAGAGLIVASYLWWLELGPCKSRNEVVCVVNANQGFLTLLALLLAAAGVWATLITTETVRQRAIVRELEQGRDAVRTALHEVHHNLVHVAIAFKGETELRTIPKPLTLDATKRLTEPHCRGVVSPRLIAVIDPLTRNFKRFADFDQEWREAGREGPAHIAMHELLRSEPGFLTGLVNNSLRFALYAVEDHPDWCKGHIEDGFQDIPAMVGKPRWICWRTSRSTPAEEARIRNENLLIATWFDDKPIGVPTHSFGQRFADAARAHRRHD